MRDCSLEIEDLKTLLHQKRQSRKDRALLILATFDKPCSVKDIVTRARDVAGLRGLEKWNLSRIFSRTNGLAIRPSGGWEITDGGKQYLQDNGYIKNGPPTRKEELDLRAKLPDITDTQTREFVEEAIKCYEYECFRSAVVMSWQAAVHVLYRHVCDSHLQDFNTEAKRVDKKWKEAKNTDGLCRMKESIFLDRLAAIDVIGEDLKKELKKALDFRNRCGHPNSVRISSNNVASHLDRLLLNVFNKFH